MGLTPRGFTNVVVRQCIPVHENHRQIAESPETPHAAAGYRTSGDYFTLVLTVNIMLTHATYYLAQRSSLTAERQGSDAVVGLYAATIQGVNAGPEAGTDTGRMSFNLILIPEPMSITLVGLAVVGFGLIRCR